MLKTYIAPKNNLRMQATEADVFNQVEIYVDQLRAFGFSESLWQERVIASIRWQAL
jgi:hypothetical protein